MPNIRNKRAKNKLKLPFILGCVVVVIISAYIGTRIYRHYNPLHTKSNRSEPTKEDLRQESAINNSTKDKAISGSTDTKVGSHDTNTQVQPPVPSIDISARQDPGGDIIVTTKLYNVSSGNCLLSVSNGSQSISKTASIVYQPEFSTCAGFSIQRSELGAGTWSIKLAITTSVGTTSKSISFEIE